MCAFKNPGPDSPLASVDVTIFVFSLFRTGKLLVHMLGTPLNEPLLEGGQFLGSALLDQLPRWEDSIFASVHNSGCRLVQYLISKFPVAVIIGVLGARAIV